MKVEKRTVAAPNVGWETLVGYFNPENKWPMRGGNCFGMTDNNIEIGWVVNFRSENFHYLIKNTPDLVKNLKVEILAPGNVKGSKHYILITDERLVDWITKDICTVCIPLVVRDYITERRGQNEF